MRKLTTLALTVAVLGVFGCAPEPDPIDAAEGQRRMEAALVGIDNVTEVTDVKYELQRPISQEVHVMGATLHSDSEDPTVNRAILEEAGRRIADTMKDNFPRKSTVSVWVLTPSETPYRFRELGMQASPTLDELAAHFGVPRGR
ncbi:hypothetical protein GCM10025789_12240 [Tessaracoccus lubricantis]|uniref:Uncharacterized protein n=1 Tax=Tessaracoccus lubricantis TaxID=545543 RepID=A0ABP9F7K8_9ACTN